MKNPLPVSFWLLSQDADRGLLEQRGFRVRNCPDSEGPVYYRPCGFHLTPDGFWLDEEDSRLFYSSCGRFYEAPRAADTSDKKRVPLAAGLKRVLPHLERHERWVMENCGRDYRTRMLKQAPFSARRYQKNWKLHFSSCYREVSKSL